MTKPSSTISLLLLTAFLLPSCGAPVAQPAANATPAPAPSPTEPGPLAPQGEPRESYYAPFPRTIELDGDLGDWDRIPRVTIPETAINLEGATSVSFAATADESFLYFSGDVSDPTMISGEHGTDYWNEDSIELYLNATGDLTLGSYTPGVAQITIPPLNIGRAKDDPLLGGIQHEDAQPQVKVVETDSGYVVEAAVPLETEEWDIQPEHGRVLGFQVHLNGASTASRNLKAIWAKADQNDSSYYDPSVFGRLIFFRIGETEPAQLEQEPIQQEALPTVLPDALYRQADEPIAARVEDLLIRMSLAEKVGQMTLVEKNSIEGEEITRMHIGGLLSGGGGYPAAGNDVHEWASMVNGFQDHALNSRLGVPLIYGVDAVHGHSNLKGAVVFPHNIGLGAANDPALMEEIGRVTAVEMAATGIYWNYAPGVMVPQDVRWGRTYEGYSENTAVVSELAASYLRGLQSEELFVTNQAIGTLKHFVGDGGTAWGSSTTDSYQLDQGDTQVSEETLRQVHLPPYQAVIEAGARSIMISFSSWNGVKLHGHQYLITDVLKGELGFDGFVVSDWGGIDQISTDYHESVVTAINAGIDMNMVPHSYGRFINTLINAVEDGDVPMSRIDDAVRRILTVKLEMGLFEQPYSQAELAPLVGSEAHRNLAREAVAESLVLLKNDGDLLPLSSDISQLLIAGRAADDIGIQSGGWTIEWQGRSGQITEGTTILEGIQSQADPDLIVEYELSGNFEADPGRADALCLAVVGELPYAEGRGDSRELNLPPGENRVLRRLERECANLAVVLVSGRPLIITEALANWDALVAAWLPGTEGTGVADVLLGEVPFSGSLPFTWPASTDQLPLGSSEGSSLFPYGYGLNGE